jgi:2-phosphosulfolactate phosphatase
MSAATGPTVTIDCFPESVGAYRDGYALVAVDVIRATTTAVTAVSLGRRCYPVASVETAAAVASGLNNPVLAGEIEGNMPPGFEMNNSPADLEHRADVERPLVLLSTSGTRLICGAADRQTMYVACLRNYHAQINHLISHHSKVAIIGAGSRNEFREEDQLCCAWIAAGLVAAGYTPASPETEEVIGRWRHACIQDIVQGNSARYLCRSGQSHDLEFILKRVADVDEVYVYHGGEIKNVTRITLPNWRPASQLPDILPAGVAG